MVPVHWVLITVLCAGGGVRVAGVAGAPAVTGDRYRIVTMTGNVLGAGTDAKVMLQFADMNGITWVPVFTQTKVWWAVMRGVVMRL